MQFECARYMNIAYCFSWRWIRLCFANPPSPPQKKERGSGGGDQKALRPRAPRAGTNRKAETRNALEEEKTEGHPQSGGGRKKTKTATGTVRRTKNRSRGRPVRPSQDAARTGECNHTHTGGGLARPDQDAARACEGATRTQGRTQPQTHTRGPGSGVLRPK